MHTKDILADALEKAKLPDMAAKARTGYYHDFLSPLDMPEIQLVNDLRAAGTPAAADLIVLVMDGQFDASLEESEAWANSTEGKAAFGEFMPHGR